MRKQVIVISLGGSQIIPDKVNTKFLKEFKKIIQKNSKKYKFVIVCGGGSLARKYISALKENKINETLQSYAGIASTRTNARFVSYFFNQDQGEVPHTTKTLKKLIKKQDVVFCGALEYKPKQTSDSTAASIAKKFKTNFINFTNVKGLYDKNPKQYKNAKFIKEISWKEFHELATATKFTPGQHFVLDHTASKIIMDNQIKTYIIGSNKELDNILSNRKFIGTLIQN